MIPERTASTEVDDAILAPLADPPDRAEVVIVGGGIVGASVAYHLTALGARDVLVVERGRLTNGTTWHAAGLVAEARGTHALTALSKGNADLYERLPGETGVETGFRRVGSMTVARTPARMQEYLAAASVARDAGIDVQVLAPRELAERWPPIVVDDLVGGTFYPRDGTVNPADAALALAKGARDRGARFAFGVTVTGFRSAAGRITHVRSDRGEIEAGTVVLAAGLWTGELARLLDVRIPLYPAEHVWVITEPTAGADERLPILRDLDGYFYVRHYRGGYMVGAFEPRGRPRSPADVDPGGFVEWGPDWEHIEPVLAKARERLPELRGIGFRHFLRAPESFTPDANLHLGAVPEIGGLFVAAGMNSQGIIFAPGVGRALAEWIVSGHPTMDLTEVDVARSQRWQGNRSWLHARTTESLGRLYAMHWPGLQPSTGRGVRRLPLADRLRAAGAAFGEAAGWERPAWYEPGASAEPDWGYDFDRPSWFGAVAEEVRAARQAAAFIDLSSYAKFLVQGPGALAGLERLCTSTLDRPPGRVVYTTICNERGGIEMDPTVTRLREDAFLVVAPTLHQRRTEALLRSGLPSDAAVVDVTSAYAVLHVAGPRSRELLGSIVDADLGPDAFPFFTAREVDVAWATALALRVSYTGELGWELYVPSEFAAGVYDAIVEAGAPLGLRHAGTFAFDALRLERGFRSWGHDVGPLDDPFASGLGFAVDPRKQAFVGSGVLAGLRGSRLERRLVSVRLADPAPMLWHGESVLRDGERVGHVTSGAYGATLGAAVGLAWVHRFDGVDDDWLASGRWSVEVRDRTVPAVVQAAPFYDPDGSRARS
ncbi:MAG: dehydrogenase [Actinomycetota bacterium]|jgi:4-methylaminobutanoate oxidase (formaldehyde-forming)|nr:MAG: dehydrogenase [Actinomycetota bacterium]